jgi:hypothetical protein
VIETYPCGIGGVHPDFDRIEWTNKPLWKQSVSTVSQCEDYLMRIMPHAPAYSLNEQIAEAVRDAEDELLHEKEQRKQERLRVIHEQRIEEVSEASKARAKIFQQRIDYFNSYGTEQD